MAGDLAWFELDMIVPAAASAAATLSVREAAELLGRDRTRVYALVRSGVLAAMADPDDRDEHALRIDRSSVERWAVAGGSRGGPLTPLTPGRSSAWPVATGRSPNAAWACSSGARSFPASVPDWHAKASNTWRRGCVGALRLPSCTCRQRLWPRCRVMSTWSSPARARPGRMAGTS